MVERITQHKDLGIIFDDKLKFHDHTSTVAGKGNGMLGLISKPFEFLVEPEMASKLYKALVQPILEYSNPVCMGTYFYSGPKKNCTTHLLEATPIQRDWQC